MSDLNAACGRAAWHIRPAFMSDGKRRGALESSEGDVPTIVGCDFDVCNSGPVAVDACSSFGEKACPGLAFIAEGGEHLSSSASLPSFHTHTKTYLCSRSICSTFSKYVERVKLESTAVGFCKGLHFVPWPGCLERCVASSILVFTSLIRCRYAMFCLS